MSMMLILAILVGALGSQVAGSSVGPPPGSASARGDDIERYDRLLDTVLPKPDAAGSNVAYVLALRVVPYEGAERQLSLRVLYGRIVQAEMAVLSESDTWAAMKRGLSEGRSDSEIVAQVKVERRQLTLQETEVDRWHVSLLSALSALSADLKENAARYRKTGERSVSLHGTRYEVWYTQGEINSYWRFWDTELDAKVQPESPLGRWMKLVFLSAERSH